MLLKVRTYNMVYKMFTFQDNRSLNAENYKAVGRAFGNNSNGKYFPCWVI